ncbi:MAG: hypothetical protein RRC34_15100 [Lentisphaeria bacterium]|nr:hypothetical protein [Lentisphaeria bacterium]
MPVRRIVIKNSKHPRSLWRICAAVSGAALSGLYLLNLSFGLLEIPDNLPIVGNVDEVAVSAFFYGCLSYLGLDLIPFRRKGRKEEAEQTGAG